MMALKTKSRKLKKLEIEKMERNSKGTLTFFESEMKTKDLFTLNKGKYICSLGNSYNFSGMTYQYNNKGMFRYNKHWPDYYVQK